MANKEPKLEYKTKKEQRSAKEDFMNLKNHPGWQRIVTFYNGKIEYLEKVINGDIKTDEGKSVIKSLEDLERYRDKRNMAIELRDLPDKLITFEELNETQQPDLDPFD